MSAPYLRQKYPHNTIEVCNVVLNEQATDIKRERIGTEDPASVVVTSSKELTDEEHTKIEMCLGQDQTL